MNNSLAVITTRGTSPPSGRIGASSHSVATRTSEMKRLDAVLAAVTILAVMSMTSATNDTAMLTLLAQLLQKNRYNPSVRPGTSTGTPTVVTVDMHIEAVGKMSEVDMDFPVTLYLNQEWTDSRLSFNDSTHIVLLPENKEFSVWIPDIYFVEGKDERLHDVPSRNELIRFDSKGRVLLSQRISLRVVCNLLLHRFPLDVQKCRMDLESFGHSVEDIMFKWKEDTLRSHRTLKIPHFILMSIDIEGTNRSYSRGVFSSLNAKFTLKREIGHYLIDTYVPSILIVILSWLSFWIDHRAIPARISLGLLTVLTMSTQSSSAQSQLPKVSYVKSIDVWMSTCLVFVFAALIEYAIVCVLAKKHIKKKSANNRGLFMIYNISNEMAVARDVNEIFKNLHDLETPEWIAESRRRVGGPGKVGCRDQKEAGVAVSRADQIERISRFAFPLTFVVFNAFYWIYYIVLF